MTSNGEIIHLHIGQAGVQIANACWELYCLEHGINPNGCMYNGHPLDDSFKPFFACSNTPKLVPRIVMVDSEPTVIDEVRTGTYGSLFKPETLITGKEDSGSNFARGYNVVGAELIDITMNTIRYVSEACCSLKGFIAFRSIGGGTGSGLGDRIMEEIFDEYGKTTKLDFIIVPSPSISPLIVEPYNSVLATHVSMDFSDCTFILDNEALYDICNLKLNVVSPSYTNLNRIIGQAISAMTASQRFYGSANVCLTEFQTNLVPFPRIHFPLVSYAPMLTMCNACYTELNTEQLTFESFHPSSQLVRCNPADGKYMSCVLLYRGNVAPVDINSSIRQMKSRSAFQFVDWCPSGFKIGLNSMPPCAVPGGDVGPADRAVMALTNNTIIHQAWCRMLSKFDHLYKRRAFIHHFVSEGMEEGTFTDASEDICSLIGDYREVEGKSDNTELTENLPDKNQVRDSEGKLPSHRQVQRTSARISDDNEDDRERAPRLNMSAPDIRDKSLNLPVTTAILSKQFEREKNGRSSKTINRESNSSKQSAQAKNSLPSETISLECTCSGSEVPAASSTSSRQLAPVKNNLPSETISLECTCSGSEVPAASSTSSRQLAPVKNNLPSETISLECTCSGSEVPAASSTSSRQLAPVKNNLPSETISVECTCSGSEVPAASSTSSKQLAPAKKSLASETISLECTCSGSVVPDPSSTSSRQLAPVKNNLPSKTINRESNSSKQLAQAKNSLPSETISLECTCSGSEVPAASSTSSRQLAPAKKSLPSETISLECTCSGSVVPDPSSTSSKQLAPAKKSLPSETISLECTCSGSVVPDPLSTSSRMLAPVKNSLLSETINRESRGSRKSSVAPGASSHSSKQLALAKNDLLAKRTNRDTKAVASRLDCHFHILSSCNCTCNCLKSKFLAGSTTEVFPTSSNINCCFKIKEEDCLALDNNNEQRSTTSVVADEVSTGVTTVNCFLDLSTGTCHCTTVDGPATCTAVTPPILNAMTAKTNSRNNTYLEDSLSDGGTEVESLSLETTDDYGVGSNTSEDNKALPVNKTTNNSNNVLRRSTPSHYDIEPPDNNYDRGNRSQISSLQQTSGSLGAKFKVLAEEPNQITFAGKTSVRKSCKKPKSSNSRAQRSQNNYDSDTSGGQPSKIPRLRSKESQNKSDSDTGGEKPSKMPRLSNLNLQSNSDSDVSAKERTFMARALDYRSLQNQSNYDSDTSDEKSKKVSRSRNSKDYENKNKHSEQMLSEADLMRVNMELRRQLNKNLSDYENNENDAEYGLSEAALMREHIELRRLLNKMTTIPFRTISKGLHCKQYKRPKFKSRLLERSGINSNIGRSSLRSRNSEKRSEEPNSEEKRKSVLINEMVIDPNQMKSIDSKQMKSMDSNQMKSIDPNQMESIDSNQRKQMKCISSKQMKSIDLKQMESIDSNQTKSIDSKKMKSIDSSQSKSIDPNQMESIDSNQRNQMESIDSNQRKKMKCISSKQMKSIDSKQMESIDSNQMKSIESKKMKSIDSSQSKSIDSKQIKSIDSNQMKSIDPNQMEPIDSNQMKSIESNQMKSIDSKQAKSINRKQMKCKDSNKIKSIDPQQMEPMESKEKTELMASALQPKEPGDNIPCCCCCCCCCARVGRRQVATSVLSVTFDGAKWSCEVSKPKITNGAANAGEAKSQSCSTNVVIKKCNSM